MTIRVIRAGAYTTVQDRGRPGWQHDGVPVGGAMDDVALRIANWLVGNDANAAVLEATLRGPTITFERDMRVSITGADMDARLEHRRIAPWWAFQARAGDTLTLGMARTGCRSYIAMAGGVDVQPVLGSRSTYVRAALGGFQGRPLGRGDTLHIATPPDGSVTAGASGRADPPRGIATRHLDLRRGTVRLIPGPALPRLKRASWRALYGTPFSLAPESDRMGLRLSGEPLAMTAAPDALSAGVAMGTVQLPPGGAPIILTADRQATGGYPRLGEIATVDLPVLAQLRPGDTVRFAQVTADEAQGLYLDRERELRHLHLMLRAMR